MCLVLTHHASIDRHVERPHRSKQVPARSALSLPLSSLPPNPRHRHSIRRRRCHDRILSSGASVSIVAPCLGVLHRLHRVRKWRPQADPAEVWGPKNHDGVAMAIPMAIRPHPSPIVKDHWSIPQQCYANAVQKLLGSYLGVI